MVITGTTYDPFVPFFYTASYNADGALLWENRTNDASWADVRMPSHSLALGPDGVIAIMGNTATALTLDFDLLTITYRPDRK